jgi:hypothetical protein
LEENHLVGVNREGERGMRLKTQVMEAAEGTEFSVKVEPVERG